jgi:hypothetical protein
MIKPPNASDQPACVTTSCRRSPSVYNFKNRHWQANAANKPMMSTAAPHTQRPALQTRLLQLPLLFFLQLLRHPGMADLRTHGCPELVNQIQKSWWNLPNLSRQTPGRPTVGQCQQGDCVASSDMHQLCILQHDPAAPVAVSARHQTLQCTCCCCVRGGMLKTRIHCTCCALYGMLRCCRVLGHN